MPRADRMPLPHWTSGLATVACRNCGGEATKAKRCTNGCCAACHREVCTSGGISSPGHAYKGKREEPELPLFLAVAPHAWGRDARPERAIEIAKKHVPSWLRRRGRRIPVQLFRCQSGTFLDDMGRAMRKHPHDPTGNMIVGAELQEVEL